MKISLSIAFILFTCIAAMAQPETRPLPAITYIPHYTVEIGLNETTVLIFPAKLKPGDKGLGDNEFIVQKQPGLDNVLKLKASRANFQPTNLHVFTTDGKVYAFDVQFSANPPHTTYDLTKLPVGDQGITPDTNNQIMISGIPVNESQMGVMATKARASKPFLSKVRHKWLMKLKLQTIQTSGDLIFFGFSLANRSDLDYPIDFVKMYIEDKQKIKQSSLQQIEMLPVFSDSLTHVPAHGKATYILGVHRFTIPEGKQVFLEVYELSGGRNLTLSISNNQLLKAKGL